MSQRGEYVTYQGPRHIVSLPLGQALIEFPRHVSRECSGCCHILEDQQMVDVPPDNVSSR
jgi:hypothetical protein